MTEFQQLAGENKTEIKVKGSRFIAHATAARDRDAAESYIDHISKRFFDATHNCFAYRIGTGDSVLTRFNDDGEPSGTAGKPILQTLESLQLTHSVVIVTRYFGGTKLGTGGLVRAYSNAAKTVLENAKIRVIQITDTVRVCYPYELSNAIQAVLANYPTIKQKAEYDVNVTTVLKIRKDFTQQFIRELKDKTAGKAFIEVI
jgi:uncharacterized YigZ family protein